MPELSIEEQKCVTEIVTTVMVGAGERWRVKEYSRIRE